MPTACPELKRKFTERGHGFFEVRVIGEEYNTGEIRLLEHLDDSLFFQNCNFKHDTMDRTADHTCPVCSLTFTRSSHLQRHYDTRRIGT